MAGDLPESEWIAAAVGGDREALQQLLIRHCRSISRYVSAQCPTYLAGQIDVDDLLQETLLAAAKGFPRFRGHSSGEFRAWLRAIALNRLRDRVKNLTAQKRRGLPAVPSPQGTGGSSIVNLVTTLLDQHDTPSRSCARREEIDAVRVALAQLPGDQRQAIMLRYLEGKSTDATAQTMERSPQAVHGLICRAMVSLRQLLGTSSRWFRNK